MRKIMLIFKVICQEVKEIGIPVLYDVVSNKLPIILSEIEERCCSSSGISPKGPSYHK